MGETRALEEAYPDADIWNAKEMIKSAASLECNPYSGSFSSERMFENILDVAKAKAYRSTSSGVGLCAIALHLNDLKNRAVSWEFNGQYLQ